tara:strand:- start:18329 stop:19828 length:1500 start_codon:yes stop_codon:yes gene_type:complete
MQDFKIKKMKDMKNLSNYIFIAFILLISLTSCEKQLEEDVFSQLAPENFLATEQGLESALAGAYAEQAMNDWQGKSVLNLESWCTDEEWETGGGENQTAVLMIGFTFDATLGWARDNMWNRKFAAIRNANNVLENIDAANVAESVKAKLKAEARFVRAVCYHYLYGWFGPVPIRTNSAELEVARATEQEMLTFIETELTESIPDLPNTGSEVYGRANKGAARAFLAKFFLNSKQWQKAADAAKSVIDMNAYSLYGNFETLFRVENDRNSEFIWVHQNIVTGGPGNYYMNGAFPPSFGSDPVTGAVHTSGMANWAAQYRLYDEFYDSFDPTDKRRNLILNEYIHKENGSMIQLSDEANNRRSIKFVPDPAAAGNSHGNDFPEIRYADILLTRAEALNEVSGPTQEAIDLINEVRFRANVPNIDLGDYDKNSLRDHLLDERRWEFFSERKRREDLIRHGKFISSAISRGKPAQSYHVRFAIPQTEIDANSLINAEDQNDGY